MFIFIKKFYSRVLYLKVINFNMSVINAYFLIKDNITNISQYYLNSLMAYNFMRNKVYPFYHQRYLE